MIFMINVIFQHAINTTILSAICSFIFISERKNNSKFKRQQQQQQQNNKHNYNKHIQQQQQQLQQTYTTTTTNCLRFQISRAVLHNNTFPTLLALSQLKQQINTTFAYVMEYVMSITHYSLLISIIGSCSMCQLSSIRLWQLIVLNVYRISHWNTFASVG